MNIAVTIKQVPDTQDVKIDRNTWTLKREGVPSIMNPDDRHAIEAALALRDIHGGKVTVLSMGPPQAAEALVEAYAMNVDECILLTDRAFAGADTLATAYALSCALRKLMPLDLVICGRQAIDGDTAQVGPQLAEFLSFPQITYARKLSLKGNRLEVERETDEGYDVLLTDLPALVTVIKDIGKPRYPGVSRVVDACRNKIVKNWTAIDIEANFNRIGMNGSPTMVTKVFTPPARGDAKMLGGTVKESARELLKNLVNENVI
jgi:electron transfer flavoprotein beta subunit